MILKKYDLRFNLSSIAVNSIMILSLVLPTIKVISEIEFLHRIPVILVGLCAIFMVIHRFYLYKSYILTNIILFVTVILGFIFSGYIYTATLSPVIFGLLFYIIIGKNYSFNFYTIYKILIIFLLVELFVINFIDFKYFLFLKSDIVHSYRVLSSKIGILTGVDIYAPNSIFYGPQVASMIAIISCIMFQRHTIWRALSIILFCICFSLTSILMLIVGLSLLNMKKSLPVIILSMFILFYIFYSKNLDYSFYYETFSAFPVSWWGRPIMDKLFGYPNSTINAWSWEFGYFFILKNIGLLNVLILIIMNLILLYKSPNIHSVIVTMLHVSLIHYHPALGLGVAQLFGLHIAYAMRHDGNSQGTALYTAKNRPDQKRL